MEKIKVNLSSGTSIEKPLITAFRGTNGNYVILDNEINGTMGLPIILVSKIDVNKLVKIADKSAEWDAVKENLRQIIAGNQIDYISVPSELTADDAFFTQLTLPVVSFDSLKNNYNVGTEAVSEPTPVEPAAQAVSPEPVAQVVPEPQSTENVAPTPQVVETPVAEVVEAPQTPVAPTPVEQVAQPSQPLEASTPVEPVVSEPQPAEVVTPTPQVPEKTVPADFTADKEAFLKACENMFDALVAKFNK